MKIGMKYPIFLLGIILLFLILGGCQKPECENAADCAEQTGKTASCVEGKCSYTPLPGMCGNGLCEKNENENPCSCPSDCKIPKCEGKYKLAIDGKTEDARVLMLYCAENKCKIGVKTQVPRYLKEIEREISFGKIKFKVDYPEPLDVTKRDFFTLAIQLVELEKDVSKERGIELYLVSFFSKDRLAEKPLNNVFLKDLRVPREIKIPLSITRLPQRELLTNVGMRIDYGFTRLDKISATETREIPRTGTIEYDLPDRVGIIESGDLP